MKYLFISLFLLFSNFEKKNCNNNFFLSSTFQKSCKECFSKKVICKSYLKIEDLQILFDTVQYLEKMKFENPKLEFDDFSNIKIIKGVCLKKMTLKIVQTSGSFFKLILYPSKYSIEQYPLLTTLEFVFYKKNPGKCILIDTSCKIPF